MSPSIPVGGTSTLTFVITNPNTDNALSGVAFTDLLPLNVTDFGPVTTPQCNGGAVAVATVGGQRQIALTGGSVPASSYCTVTVDVTSSTIGAYPNTTGAVTAIINGSAVGADTANAMLTVTAVHPSISILKQVSLTGSDPWTSFVPVSVGGSVYFRFIVENTGDVALTTVTVTDPTLNPVSPFTLAGCSWANLPLYDVQTCTFGPAPVQGRGA